MTSNNGGNPIAADVYERIKTSYDLMRTFGMTVDEVLMSGTVANLETSSKLFAHEDFVHVIMAPDCAGRPAYPCTESTLAKELLERAISQAAENDGRLLQRNDVREFRSWLDAHGEPELAMQMRWLEERARMLVVQDRWDPRDATLVVHATLRQTSGRVIQRKGRQKYRIRMHKGWYIPGLVDA